MTEPRKERCETCRFWTGQRERISCRLPLLVADCHRYPPSRYLNDSDGDPPQFEQWFRPEMLSDDWCGEWQQKDTEQHRTRPVYVTDIMATFTKYCGARYLLRKLSKEIPIAADVQRSDVDRLGAKQWSKVRDQVWQAIQAALGKQ